MNPSSNKRRRSRVGYQGEKAFNLVEDKRVKSGLNSDWKTSQPMKAKRNKKLELKYSTKYEYLKNLDKKSLNLERK